MNGWSDTSPSNPGKPLGRQRGSRGVIMLEVLIAISVLTIGLVGVLSAFSPGYASVTTAGRQDDAVALAYDKLEELKNYPWASLTSGSDTPSGGFARTWTITKASTLATVQVTITHPQIPKAVNLVTYIVP